MRLIYASIIFYVVGYLIWVFFGQEEQVWYNLYYIWDKSCLLLAFLVLARHVHDKSVCTLLYSVVSVQALRIVYEFMELFGEVSSDISPKFLAASMLIGGLCISALFLLDRRK